MSIIFLITILSAAFAVTLLFRRGTLAQARVTDPSCGSCGYCVRGLERLTCPECGGDLREVGIVTPGAARPMGRGAKLALWTALSIAPALIFAQALAPRITPYNATATRNRTIFVRAPAVNCTIQVMQTGTKRMIGRPAFNTPVAPQTMTLTMASPSKSTVDVDLATGEARFSDSAGTLIKGPFDAAFIAQWINACGMNHPAVAERAQDIFAAIDEMTAGGGAGFSQYSPNPSRSMQPDVTAHPASPPFVVPRPTPFGQALPFVLMGSFWLLGLPFILRPWRRKADRAPAPA